MTTPTTNWIMRILLIAIGVAFLVAAPNALGADALGTTDATVATGLGVEAEATNAVPPELPDAEQTVADAQAQVEGTVEGTVAGVPVDEVGVTAQEATSAVTGQANVEAASDEGVGVLTKTPTKTEVAATTATLAAAAGSAGAFFWLKNGVGLALGRLVGAPLFSRLSKDELLENDGRETLFTLVTANPGIGLQELAAQSGLGWGTTVYHLGRLEQGGFITSMKNGQSRHFFKNGHPAAKSKMAIAVLKNRTASDVARFLMSTPGATQKTISSGLGIAPPTVTKYVKRLEAEGLVETLKEGRSKIVQPTGALVDALQHVDAPAPKMPEVPADVAQHTGVSAYA